VMIDCQSNPFLRPQTAVCFLGNILDLNVMNADVLYIYDEAFPPDVMEHVAQLILDSPRIKWVISFKAGRHREYKDFLEKRTGLVCEATVDTLKVGSGEMSRASIYRRLPPVSSLRSMPPVAEPNETDQSVQTKAEKYFQSNFHDCVAYYETLGKEMEKKF
jgi:hypothetical protein